MTCNEIPNWEIEEEEYIMLLPIAASYGWRPNGEYFNLCYEPPQRELPGYTDPDFGEDGEEEDGTNNQYILEDPNEIAKALRRFKQSNFDGSCNKFRYRSKFPPFHIIHSTFNRVDEFIEALESCEGRGVIIDWRSDRYEW